MQVGDEEDWIGPSYAMLRVRAKKMSPDSSEVDAVFLTLGNSAPPDSYPGSDFGWNMGPEDLRSAARWFNELASTLEGHPHRGGQIRTRLLGRVGAWLEVEKDVEGKSFSHTVPVKIRVHGSAHWLGRSDVKELIRLLRAGLVKEDGEVPQGPVRRRVSL